MGQIDSKGSQNRSKMATYAKKAKSFATARKFLKIRNFCKKCFASYFFGPKNRQKMAIFGIFDR